MLPRSSQMSVGAATKMLAKKEFELRSNREVYRHATFHVRMARIEYFCFNNLTVEDNLTPNILSTK